MKKLTYLIFIALLLFGLFACSEDDKPTEARILGYSLDQFIDANTVRAKITSDPEDTEDYRGLFNYELVATTCVIMFVPILILYIFTQRSFRRGVTMGAVK